MTTMMMMKMMMTMRTGTTINRFPEYAKRAAHVVALSMLLSLHSFQAVAQTQTRMPVDRVTEALVTLGYSIDSVSRTWLGRIRIEASKGSVSRELIVNRVTGEVLRDYWEDDDEDDHGDDDDDHDDDEDDDDDEEDDDDDDDDDGDD